MDISFDILYEDNQIMIDNPSVVYGHWRFMILHHLPMIDGCSLSTHVKFPVPRDLSDREPNAIEARTVIDGSEMLDIEVFPRLRIMRIPETVLSKIKQSLFDAFKFESVEKAKEFIEAEKVAIRASFSPQRKGGRS